MSLKTPNQIGQANKYLFTDGQKTSWQTVASPTVTDANNGVSLSGTVVNLGNAVGGTAGQLTSNREIPLNGFDISYTGSGKLVVPVTTSATTGVIYKGTPASNNRFLHNFGTQNVLLGTNAGNFTLTGQNNVGFGFESLQSLTTGSDNVGLGISTLRAVNAGAGNIAVGRSAGLVITSGSNNIMLGLLTGSAITTGSRNILLGATTGDAITGGNNNIGVGHNSLSIANNAIDNVAVGINSGGGIVNGERNLAIGSNTLFTSNNATDCIAIGSGAFRLSSGTMLESVAIGTGAGEVSTGSFNIFIGHASGQSSTTAERAIVIGNRAGFVAGSELTTASDAILIGERTGMVGGVQRNNSVAIGSRALIGSASTIVLGASEGVNGSAITHSVITGGNTVDASAQLQVDSTTKGVLFPRMTTAQRTAIVSPASGLVVYDTTVGKLFVRGASAWEQITSV